MGEAGLSHLSPCHVSSDNSDLPARERKKFIIRQPPIKNSCMVSPAAVEGGGEATPQATGGGRGESGERSEVQARSLLTSTAPKVRSRSREFATLNEAPRISLRMSSKLLSSASSSLSALARTSACPSTTAAFARTLASSLTLSKPEEGRRAQGLEEAL